MQVSQRIRIIGQEIFFVGEVFFHRLQPLADVRAQTGVHEGNLPIRDVAFLEVHLLVAVRQRKVAGQTLIVIEEELFDDIRLVAEAQNEVLMPVMSIVFHDVPQDWPIANVHHRLGQCARHISQARAQSTAE